MWKAWTIAVGITAGGFLNGLFGASPANIVLDGGFEEVSRRPVFRSPYLDRAIKDGVQLSREGEDAVLPANFDQFLGTKVLKVVEGQAGETVHSGKRAILLRGDVYLRPATPHSYRTQEGDMYTAEFYAKGQGNAAVWLHVYGTGKVNAVPVESKGQPHPSQWTKIERTFLIVGAGAREIFPRLAASEQVLIDDLVIRKTSEQQEAAVAGEYASPRERSKSIFVHPLRPPPTIDGRLDEPVWQGIPESAGFLAYGDQALLAEPSTTVRLGYDALNLYLGIACTEPDLSILSLLDRYQNVSDEKWIGPTTVEVFLDPGRSRLNYYQFAVTARGHKYDGFKMDSDWNGSWEAKTALAPSGYSFELRIPFASLGVRRPAIGDVWGLNVSRHRDTTHSTWAPVGPNFHQPSAFGQMVFGSLDDWYRKAFLSGTAQRRAQILERSGRLPMAGLDERLRLVDAYAAAVRMRIEKGAVRGFTDWRQIAGVYAMGGFVLDSYGRILTCTEWALLGATGR
jgi:hypothetical protein